jgi:hypothetical protein
MKTLVLIHGLHLGAKHWEDLAWGDPATGRLGKAAKGIAEAVKFDASIIVFGSGASQKGGTYEAQFTYNFALEHLAVLATHIGMTPGALKEWLNSRVRMDVNSQNTRDEVHNAFSIARENGIDRIILVSNPWHILRCMQVAFSECAKDTGSLHLLDNLYATASDPIAGEMRIDDIVIIEPPHRPDRPDVPFTITLKGLIPFMTTDRLDVALNLNDALKKVIAEWKQKL